MYIYIKYYINIIMNNSYLKQFAYNLSKKRSNIPNDNTVFCNSGKALISAAIITNKRYCVL